MLTGPKRRRAKRRKKGGKGGKGRGETEKKL